MNKLYIIILLLVFCVDTFVFAQEPSAFRAGNIEDRNPYGLSVTEQYILKNKKKIQRLNSKIQNLEKKIQTISDLFLDNISKLKQDLKNSNKKIESIKGTIQSNILVIQEELNLKINNNKQDTKKLREIFLELTELTKTINTNYISKEVFEKKINSVIKQKAIKQKIKNNFAKINNISLMKKGKKVFANKKIKQAKDIFKELLKRYYQVSKSNYYLAELNFMEKNYKQSLILYKRSVDLDAKALYMPRLLLHSAISSYKIKNKKDAIEFLKSIIKNYPKAKEVKEAKILLSKY
jgi:TolA-binding protein